MICKSCADLADESARRRVNPRGGNKHLSHTNKKPPHCEAPLTCTCHHRKATPK